MFCKVEILSDDEEEEEVLTLTDENKPTALEKMIALIALLVEKSRGNDKQLHLSQKDYMAIVGGGKVRLLVIFISGGHIFLGPTGNSGHFA